MPDIAIIIVNYNTVDMLGLCLESVFKHSVASETEVIVVDNASRDGSCDMVRMRFPKVKLIPLENNVGFGGGNNIGVEAATARIVVLFNSDAIFCTDTPRMLADYLDSHPDVACVAPRVVLPSGAIQPRVFGHLPTLWRVLMQSTGLNLIFPRTPFFAGIDGLSRSGPEMHVGWVSGVCMAMRREQFVGVGGFDTRFFMYCEDIDLCRRIARHGRIVLLDAYPIIHYGGASSKNLASRVRNAVWQQHNLLLIVSDTSGKFAVCAARGVIFCGLLLRFTIGLVLIPAKGIGNNFVLRSASARLTDVLGLRRAISLGRA